MPLTTAVANAHTEYENMAAKWRAIISQPLSSDAKWNSCFWILCNYIDRIALSRARQPNPVLRFYADMLVLRQQLYPAFANDELGETVILPAYRMVDRWVRSNTPG